MAKHQSEVQNLAYEAYNAYREVNYRSWLFDREWHDLTDTEREGWMQATLHVMRRTKGMYGAES